MAHAALPVVGMVASAGGLAAYTKFFQAMPVDSGMAFVLVPHLDPMRGSVMTQLLARRTAMPVVEATEGMRLQANHVYVIPPNNYLALRKGVLHLHGPMARGAGETAIDKFLCSLAEDQGEQAIGIILSGTGTHGALGVKAIKANGGTVLVQEPGTATQPRMPQSAIDTGLVDYVLPVEKMPHTLLQYIRHFFRPGAAVPEPAAMPDDLTQVLELLRARTKFDFRSYRKRMLLRRIQRRMGLAHLGDMTAYLELLRGSPEELKRLNKDLLITVTSFFRDPEMFQILEAQVVPELLRRKAAEVPLRVWVPACATGEEAYSLAMLLIEGIAAAGKSCPLQVFATDIEPEALETARRGVYADSLLVDLGPRRLAQFFTKVDEHNYQANEALREAVLFAQHNLLADAPFSKLDLVSCRNLLIYLEPDIQQKLLELLHFALNEDGYLILGPSESVGRPGSLFEPVSRKWRIFRRVGIARRARLGFPIQAGAQRGEARFLPAVPSHGRPVSFAELTRELLLKDFGPATVLIRRNYEVLHFHGATERYLQQPSGPPTEDLMLLAREGLRARLREAVDKALRVDRRVSLSGARIRRNDHYVTVRVTARPLHIPRAVEGLMLVSFEDEDVAPRAPRRRGTPAADKSVARQLEQELKSTREELQHTIEELENSNEELKASHEEVMSMNEELQSTNEELETSKEELQSLNEELTAVNNQMQDKLDELEAANDDMVNVLTSADIATLYLAADHIIKRFSTPANRVFRLISADVGRPIEDIRSRVDDPALPADVDAVLQTLTPREQKVRTDDGYWYLRRINPYRTADNRIEGVVVSYMEITALQRVEEDLRELTDQFEARVTECSARLRAERNFVDAVFETVAALVVVLDRDGRVVRWNKACEQATGYRAAEMNEPAAWERLLLSEEKDEVQNVFEELRAGHCPNRHENHWRHRDGSLHLIAWSNTCLRDSAGEVEYIVGTGVDVTQQRRSEEEARLRQAELAHLHRVYTAGEFAAVMAHELNQPLTAIAGYSEAGLQLLRRGQLEPAAIIDKLEQIALQAQRAGQTIRELRKFLKRDEPQERHPVKLNELIHDIARLLTPEARASGVRIVPALSTEPLTILASDVQIEHVLVNLVQNAIEAIRAAGKPAGTITVRTAAEPEGMARVTVQDDGPGFNGEPPERLFERFYTTKPDGLGMGLVICRAIIRAHNGKIWAERPAEGGAAFHFTVPRQP